MTIRSYKNKASEDIAYGISSKRARSLLPIHLHEKARLRLARVDAAGHLQDFLELHGNRFEVLKGDRAGQCSIRINDQFRICFLWINKEAREVEIVDYHS